MPSPHSTPLLRALSLATGFLADCPLPSVLRPAMYRTFARLTGANLAEVGAPLRSYPSLGAFFIRHLTPGARPIDPDPAHLVSPVDARVQTLCSIREGSVLQAKGHDYSVRDMLAGIGEDIELEGGFAWTLYLGPKDYHRIHSPEDVQLTQVKWVDGARYSVAGKVLAKRRVLDINERCILRLESTHGPMLLVLVGALNVGRIRVCGVEQGPDHSNLPAPLPAPLSVQRGEELARFEMGSTIVLFTPPGLADPLPTLGLDDPVQLGQPIGTYRSSR